MNLGKVEQLNDEELDQQIKTYENMFGHSTMTRYGKKNIRKEIKRLEKTKLKK